MNVAPVLIRATPALQKWLMIVASLMLAASHPAMALDAVSMQLKWKHQFQFAGYYQALEQGFYRDSGLDVTIREGGPGIDVSEAVAGGNAHFGVCSAGVLRDWAAGRRLVVLAVIFQRSAAVILVARRADISSVADLRGRTLMDTPGSDKIAAMLKREGIDYQTMLRVPHEGNPRDLLAGRADAMVAYSTNEPFVLEQLGASYRTFAPVASGIDFYGDSAGFSDAGEVMQSLSRPASDAYITDSCKGLLKLCAHVAVEWCWPRIMGQRPRPTGAVRQIDAPPGGPTSESNRTSIR
jgi:ABC-type nitrate/sulfonate/bicarbonate transport system substrate-binding protein